MKKRSFTIIELLLAFGVLIILMGITIGTYTYISEKNKRTRTAAMIKKLELAMISYEQDVGYYFQQPSAGPLTINPGDSDFIKHVDYSKMLNTNQINSANQVIDAWGNPIIYQCPGFVNRTLFDLISYGKNGVDDSGTGDDITNFTKH
jgi:type II secretory pathway pseudopilin PulG